MKRRYDGSLIKNPQSPSPSENDSNKSPKKCPPIAKVMRREKPKFVPGKNSRLTSLFWDAQNRMEASESEDSLFLTGQDDLMSRLDSLSLDDEKDIPQESVSKRANVTREKMLVDPVNLEKCRVNDLKRQRDFEDPDKQPDFKFNQGKLKQLRIS